MAPLVAEELVLLAYHPDGVVRGHGVELDCALAGALLLELVDAAAVTMVDGRLRSVPDGRPGGHPVLVEAMDQITARPDRSPEWWIPRLSRGLCRRLLDGLVNDGVLAEQTSRRLGITRHRFPECDDRARLDAQHRLSALLDDPAPPAARTAALAGMVNAAKLTGQVFGNADRRAIERRLAEVADGEWAAGAVRKAVQAVYAATVSAAAAASVATTAGN